MLQRPFRFYIRHFSRAFSLGIAALFFTNLLDVLTPMALKYSIDAIAARDLPNLRQTIGVYLALMMGVAIFRYFWRVYFGRFHHCVAEDLRNRIFAKLTQMGPSFFQKNPVGELMSVIINDVNSFRMAIGPGVLILLDGVFLIAMILPLMIFLSWDWTWKCLLLVPLLPFLIRHMEDLIHRRFRVAQDRLSEVSGAAQEILSGIRVIKSYAQEEGKKKQFDRIGKSYEEASNLVAKADSAFDPLMQFAVTAGSVVLLYYCSSDVVLAKMTLGTFVAFYEYIKKMAWPMSAIGMGVSMFEQGRASFDRIRKLLASENDIPDIGTTDVLELQSIELKNLTFTYPDSQQPVLHNIDLCIQRGETIGLVGPVGAGKSTLAQVLLRLYPTASGQILINGQPIETLRLTSLRQLIAMVPQEAFLFSDKISDNITLGCQEPKDLADIRHMASVVNIDDEISDLPQGYDSYLGERGVNLSGGQKQRLTIARAMIRNAQMIVMDDSLSAVDGKTESAIVKALRSTMNANRPTTLLISHRLATLKHADRIVVLNQGRIEAVGRHEELLGNSPTYQRLQSLQERPAEHSNAEAIP